MYFIQGSSITVQRGRYFLSGWGILTTWMS